MYLSHFNLLFRHGSQLIALRARFVGGRPSPFCSPVGGEVLPRTVPVVVDLGCFCLEDVGDVVEGVLSSAMGVGGWKGKEGPIETFGNYGFLSNKQRVTNEM